MIFFPIALRSVDKLLTDFDEVMQLAETQRFFIRYNIDSDRIRLKHALGMYTSQIKNVVHWCDSTMPALNQMINGNNDDKSQPKESLLAKALNDGLQIISTVRMIINHNNVNFKNIIRDVDIALNQITADLRAKTDKIEEDNDESYKNLKNKIQISNNDVTNFWNQFKSEIITIDNIKLQIKTIQSFLVLNEQLHDGILDEIRDEILSSVEKLIAECNDYSKRHE